MNETIRNIQSRRSCRSFLDDPIPDELLDAVIGAGLYAPHAGDVAWHFTAVRNAVLLDRLNTAAKQAAAASGIPHLQSLGCDARFHCLYHAPALVIVSGDDASPVPLQADCAAANENMLIAAQSLGLGSCWIYFVLMAFQSPQGSALKKELQLPEGYTPYAAAVFGYKKEEAAVVIERSPGLITHID